MSCMQCFCKEKDAESTLEVESTRNLYAFQRKKMANSFVEGKKDKIKQYRTSLKKSWGGQQNQPEQGRVERKEQANLNVRASYLKQQNTTLIDPHPKRVQQQAISFIQPPQIFPQHVHEISLQPQHRSSGLIQHNYYSYNLPKKQTTSTNFSHVVRIPSLEQQSQYQSKPKTGAEPKFFAVQGSAISQFNKTQSFGNGHSNKECDKPKYQVVLLSVNEGKPITPQKQSQALQPINQNRDELLKPADQLDMFSSRISRASGVRNIDEIACTKTQSIGSESSSEFSDVVFSSVMNKQTKLTNSSINFHQENNNTIQPTSQSLISSRRKSQNKKPCSSFK